jgi:hypothetical protein
LYTFDDFNCGACGQTCDAGFLCNSGQCVSVVQLTTPVSDPGGGAVSEEIFIFGGRNDAGPLVGTLQLYTPDNEWMTLDDLPVARYGIAGITINENVLLAAGGYASDGGGGFVPTSEVDTLANPHQSNDWETVVPGLPNPIAFAGTASLGPSAGYGVYTTELIMGGENDGVPTDAVEFDRDASYGDWLPFADLPIPVSRAGGATLRNSIYPSFVAFEIGGVQADGSVSNQVLSAPLSSSTGASWTPHAVWPNPRAGAAFACDGSRFIYALGGQNSDGSFSNEFDIYDSVLDVWAVGPPLHTARAGFVAGYDSFTGRLYAVGGYNGQFLTTVEAFTWANGAWAY